MSPLNPDKMPASAVPLIPLAERWGIGDDFEREDAVEKASRDELQELTRRLEELDEDYWDWLAGPESYAPAPTTEYVAMSNLTLAMESARSELANRAT